MSVSGLFQLVSYVSVKPQFFIVGLFRFLQDFSGDKFLSLLCEQAKCNGAEEQQSCEYGEGDFESRHPFMF